MEKNFVPNTQWMAEKYSEMNALLFNGALGDCDFNIFTTGKGSGGNTLGWFKITGNGIKIDRRTRKMYHEYYRYVGDFSRKEYIDKDNFVSFCKPRIELNGNYTGTEHAFLGTLVHEMCHYYTYMDGWAPTQAHGREFKDIGRIVSSRSNGMFTIQRLATAEEMTEFELNDEMKARKEKRMVNKKSSATAIITFFNNGTGNVRLTIAKDNHLINVINQYYLNKGEHSIITNDSNVIDFLFSKGYRSVMRTFRWWDLSGQSWLGELKALLNKSGNDENNEEVPTDDVEVQAAAETTPTRTFVIKTTSGEFKCKFRSEDELINKIKERFPKMNDETIRKIMSNPSNYVNEGKRTMKDIINEVIEEFIANETGMNVGNNKDIEINPNMNLGKYSPLQLQ